MKMYAFKFQNQNPNRLEGVPLNWIWEKIQISEAERESYEKDGWGVSESDDLSVYMFADSSNIDVKILDLVDTPFIGLPLDKIDFRKHLRSDVYLQKNVELLPNGRPSKSIYTYKGVLIAEIEFVFEVNSFNFMTRRKELLSYYKVSEEKTEQWVIADDVYDVNNAYHLREMMKERSEARSLILEGVKAFLNGVLAQYYVPQGKSYPEILMIAGDFWGAYSKDIDSWINVGSPRFSINLNADTSFAFLSVTVAPQVTVRAYMLNKISY